VSVDSCARVELNRPEHLQTNNYIFIHFYTELLIEAKRSRLKEQTTIYTLHSATTVKIMTNLQTSRCTARWPLRHAARSSRIIADKYQKN